MLQDLESIQSLLERQQGFQRDAEAIKDQVAEVMNNNDGGDDDDNDD